MRRKVKGKFQSKFLEIALCYAHARGSSASVSCHFLSIQDNKKVEHTRTWLLSSSLCKSHNSQHLVTISCYTAPYQKYGSKIFLSNALFLTLFLPDFCQLLSRQHRHLCSRLNMKLFFHQSVAKLPWIATGIERILKTFKIWSLLEK